MLCYVCIVCVPQGNQYWRFENAIMDAGFPRPISEGFGLGGHIVAALSMPQYRSRRESVLFFKKGSNSVILLFNTTGVLLRLKKYTSPVTKNILNNNRSAHPQEA